ncbi:MAG: outer membrane beta-barrel protein [Tabrizicola sp.]|nr:outer membrane beta-barrel protein [Tabrizicola sp.]
MKILPLALAIAAALPASAMAQEMYYGGGLAYSSMTSDRVLGGSGTSELKTGMVSMIVGQRFAAGDSAFWAWEANADLSFGAKAENPDTGLECALGASGSYLCGHDATLRLVGIYGAPVGQGTEIFGSFGLAVLVGETAVDTDEVDSGMHSGMTVGLGLSHALANGMTLRGEVIYDHFTKDNYDVPVSGNISEVDATTFRLSLLRRF